VISGHKQNYSVIYPHKQNDAFVNLSHKNYEWWSLLINKTMNGYLSQQTILWMVTSP